MGSNQEVGENSARSWVAVFSAALRICLKGAAGSSPYCFAQMPVNGDSCVFKKSGDEGLASVRGGYEFGEYGGGDDEISAMEGGVKSSAGGRGDDRVGVPQGDDDVGIDRGCHRIQNCVM